jgi:hypothetical protein
MEDVHASQVFMKMGRIQPAFNAPQGVNSVRITQNFVHNVTIINFDRVQVIF